MTSVVPDYNPTPLEYAYTSYLLEAVFDLDTSVPEIKISGREAVTFLSKSAVHRLILRNLWTTVDPNSAGSLLHRHQLSTLLRCVALAQYPKKDSLLDQALRSAYHEQKSPVEAIRACLVATSQQTDIPLASFDGISLPDRATLLPYLKEGTEEDDEEETETDDFGDFSTATPPTTTTTPMPAHHPTAPVAQQTGWGAFDTLSSDAHNGGGDFMPQQQSVAMSSPATGGLMPAQQQMSNMGLEAPSFPSMQEQQQPVNNNSQPWGSIDSTTPVPTQMSMQNQQPHQQQQQQLDQFGGFAAASSTMSSGSVQQPASSGWDALDALAPPISTPPTLPSAPVHQDQQNNDFGDFSAGPVSVDSLANPSNSGMAHPNAQPTNGMVQTADGDFGGFTSSAPQPSVQQSSGWDALDALASSTPDPPPPSLSNAMTSPQPVPEVSSDQGIAAPSNEDDDFGDFAAAHTAQQQHPPQQSQIPGGWDAMDAFGNSAAAAMPSTEPASSYQASGETDDFGGFSSVQPQMQQPAQPASQEPSGWDALDALVASSPAPPPTLPDPSTTVNQPSVETTGEVHEQADDDEFGDFASTTREEPQSQSPATGWDAMDALAAPAPASPGTNGVASPEQLAMPVSDSGTGSGGLGALDALSSGIDGSPNQQRQQQANGSAAPTSGLGGIAAAEPLSQPDENGLMTFETSTQERQDGPVPSSGWDALDALAAPPVAPPSLSTHQAAASESAEASGGGDDFGNFAGSTAEPNLFPVTHDEDGFGDFELQPPSVAPAPASDAMMSTQSADESPEGSETPQQGLLNAPFSTVGLDRAVSLSPPPEERSGIPSIPSKKRINVVRSDTAFFSARESSIGVQSEVSSLDEFVDAVQTPGDNRNEGPGMNGVKSTRTNEGQELQAADPADPFAAFESIAPAQPEPPLPPLSSFESKDTDPDASAENTQIPHQDTLPTFSHQENEIQQSEEADNDFDDDFGDFAGVPYESKDGSGTNTDKRTSLVQSNTTADDDFGDFAVGGPSVDVKAEPAMGASVQPSEMHADLFGDFAGSQPHQPTSLATSDGNLFDAFSSPAPPGNTDDDFGNFAASAPAPQPIGDFGDAVASAPSADADGDFGNFPGSTPPVNSDEDFSGFSFPATAASVPQEPASMDDDFGDFSTPTPAPDVDEDPGAIRADGLGDFGNFAPAESASNDTECQPEIDGQSVDRSFDGFGDFDAVPTHNALSDDSGDDWDAFQEASQPSTPKKNDPETENLLKTREVILAAAAHVPESLVQCVGTTGCHVDFANCFEANIGVDVPVSMERKKRMQRSLQIATMLSSDRSKLASAYWTAAISSAKDELALGYSLCVEAKNMNKTDRSIVLPALQAYIRGLGEIVRVVRMIVATIGDLLMLDATSLFTVDTHASSWCSLAILKEALEIEDTWKTISDEVSKLGPKSRDATSLRLPSISELRVLSSVTTASPGELCQFTLQPITSGCETTEAVEWGERRFTACTANFLANKCTFFSIDD